MKKQVNTLHRVWPLYGSAFMMSLTLSAWWTAMPFIIRRIGGTEGHVGYAWAANMFGYMVCLLLAGLYFGRHNPKNTTRLSSAIVCTCAVIVGILIYTALYRNMEGNRALIWFIIASGTVAGGAMSLFWPFLMSWVSEDLEGSVLNRRLGNYNGAWTCAAMIGPVVGGILVDASKLLPVIFAVFGLIVCFIFLNLATDGSLHTALFGDEDEKKANNGKNKAALVKMRWIARIALFSSWACLGVTRSQFALLFTDMGYSETVYGVLVMIFGICNLTLVTVAGRFILWHTRPYLILFSQTMIGLSLLLIIFGRGLPVFVLSFVIMGFGFGFAYSAHLYYGTCGQRKRSVPMTIHEATISIGVVVGSGSGGFLANHFGLYVPYWFILVLVGIGFMAQFYLLVRSGNIDESLND